MTTSFPGVGLGGVTADGWASTFGARDGIVEDYVGDAFAMTLLNDTNEASFTAAKISNNGYTMNVSDDERVSLPAPSSGSKSYFIGSLYDPNLQAPLAGTGTDPVTNPALADPAGPCRLRAVSGSSEITNAQRFLTLWTVVRVAGQQLSASVVLPNRRWIGHVVVDQPSISTDAAVGNEGLYPRGTLKVQGGRLFVRTPNAQGVLAWVDPLSSDPVPFPMGSAFTARQGKNAPPQYHRFSNRIALEGQLQRSSGNLSNGSTVTLGQMPAGARPDGARAFICRCGGSNNYTEVRVNNDGTTDGMVLMTDPPSSTTWIDLSPINYRIGA